MCPPFLFSANLYNYRMETGIQMILFHTIKQDCLNAIMLGILENQQHFYSWLPKIGKVTFDVSMVHFLLMFGYKLFSLYYPLFLVSIGLSLIDIGWVYLVTYSVLAISSLAVDYYVHKISPVYLAVLGILGYGIFSSLMLLSENRLIFYFAQALLGIAAATWTVSLRLILMESKRMQNERSFGWFYSMPHYANIIAPVVGGIVIWKFGFIGVFSLSVIVHIVNAIYAYFSLGADMKLMKIGTEKRRKNEFSKENFWKVIKILSRGGTMKVLMLSFIFALMLSGIYRAFLAIFLKDLSFSEEKTIQILSLSSAIYLPLSLFAVKVMEKMKDLGIVRKGILIEGIVSMFIGFFAPALNFFMMLAAVISDNFGVLLSDTGKSSFLSEKLKEYKEEASMIDTIISTLFPALGSLLGGFMISHVGYRSVFVLMGIAIFALSLFSFFAARSIVSERN